MFIYLRKTVADGLKIGSNLTYIVIDGIHKITQHTTYDKIRNEYNQIYFHGVVRGSPPYKGSGLPSAIEVIPYGEGDSLVVCVVFHPVWAREDLVGGHSIDVCHDAVFKVFLGMSFQKFIWVV
jgi:hypothetical protein